MAASIIVIVGKIVCLFSLISVISCADKFSEELYIKPLDTGHVLTHFQFTTLWDIDPADPESYNHYHIFPKSLGEILNKYTVQELHLSLTQGLWRYKKWGYPFRDSPPGAELWVWFQPHTRKMNQVWADLVNSLSGQFCSSLNFMDITGTITPQWSFRPQGSTEYYYGRLKRHLRYATLPREPVCTENLTPWKKLLPCSSKAGLAVLLNAIKLYDASYHSLQLDVRPVCADEKCSRSVLELSQSVSVVLDPRLKQQTRRDWSFRDLFGRFPVNVCPLSSDSKIYLDITAAKTNDGFRVVYPPSSNFTVLREGSKRIIGEYDVAKILQTERMVNVAVQYKQNIPRPALSPPVLHAHRYTTGYGDQKGGITCLLYNSHPTQPLTVIYMDTVPWYLRVLLHTLSITSKGKEIKPSQFSYIPGKDHDKPYQFEFVITLPPKSKTIVSYQFERALLSWTEYPPDANHGFYVPAGTISAILPSGEHYISPPLYSSTVKASLTNQSAEMFLRVRTEPLVVRLPTPDFSMPYNVICLACTVVAISFGSVHNLTTRQFRIVDDSQKKTLLQRIKQFFVKEKMKES